MPIHELEGRIRRRIYQKYRGLYNHSVRNWPNHIVPFCAMAGETKQRWEYEIVSLVSVMIRMPLRVTPRAAFVLNKG